MHIKFWSVIKCGIYAATSYAGDLGLVTWRDFIIFLFQIILYWDIGIKNITQ